MGKPALPPPPKSHFTSMIVGMVLLLGTAGAVLMKPAQEYEPAPVITSADPSPDVLRTGIQPTPGVSR